MIGQSQVKSSKPRPTPVEMMAIEAQKAADDLGIYFYEVGHATYDGGSLTTYYSSQKLTPAELEDIVGEAMCEAAEAQMRGLRDFDRELLERGAWRQFDSGNVLDHLLIHEVEEGEEWYEQPFMDAMRRRGFTPVEKTASLCLDTFTSFAGNGQREIRDELDRRLKARVEKHLRMKGLLLEPEKDE